VKVTLRTALVGVIVAASVASLGVAAFLHQGPSGPVHIQSAGVLGSPSPGVLATGGDVTASSTPDASPLPDPNGVPNPNTATTPPPAPRPAPAPAPPPPTPTYCGHAFVYAAQVVSVPANSVVYPTCTLSGGKPFGPGAVTVTGYIDTPQGRIYRIGDPVITPGAWFKAP